MRNERSRHRAEKRCFDSHRHVLGGVRKIVDDIDPRALVTTHGLADAHGGLIMPHVLH